MPNVLFACLCWLAQYAHAQTDSRLLPESFVKSVGLDWHQDGRTVELKIKNSNGSWVLQRLAIEVQYEPIEPALSQRPFIPKSNVGAPSGSNLISLKRYLEQRPETPDVYAIYAEIQPGKVFSSHIELKSNAQSLRCL